MDSFELIKDERDPSILAVRISNILHIINTKDGGMDTKYSIKLDTKGEVITNTFMMKGVVIVNKDKSY